MEATNEAPNRHGVPYKGTDVVQEEEKQQAAASSSPMGRVEGGGQGTAS